MSRKFVLQNPIPRNKKAETITASSSFEAAETMLINLIKEHMPIENRKPGKPMPFMFSIVELKGKKKVARHFKAMITRSKTSSNKDTFTLEKYKIPESHGMSITVQTKPPNFVNMTGGKKKKKSAKKRKSKSKSKSKKRQSKNVLDIERCFMDEYLLYWPDIYRDSLYCSNIYSGYYPFIDWTFFYGYPLYYGYPILV